MKFLKIFWPTLLGLSITLLFSQTIQKWIFNTSEYLNSSPRVHINYQYQYFSNHAVIYIENTDPKKRAIEKATVSFHFNEAVQIDSCCLHINRILHLAECDSLLKSSNNYDYYHILSCTLNPGDVYTLALVFSRDITKNVLTNPDVGIRGEGIDASSFDSYIILKKHLRYFKYYNAFLMLFIVSIGALFSIIFSLKDQLKMITIIEEGKIKKKKVKK